MAEWSLLPPELLDQIAKSLQAPFDRLRFRSVCSAWRYSVTPEPLRISPGCLILPNDGISDPTFSFHLSKRSILLLLQSTRLCNHEDPIPRPAWVIKIEENVPDRKSLLNPLLRHRYSPMPSDFPRVLDLSGIRVCELGQEYVLHSINDKHVIADDNLYMEKVALKWVNSESHGNFVLLTIHISGKLALFMSENKSWTTINHIRSLYDDVILFKEKLLAVDNAGRTVNVEVSGSPPEVSLVANPVFGGDKKYLVESEGQLLMVDMYISMDTEGGPLGFGEEFDEHSVVFVSERTVSFIVYKLDEEMQMWVVMRNLGNEVLFLGDHSTFASSASNLSLPKGNCIFFIDNFSYVSSSEYCGENEEEEISGGLDIGVFDLESGCIGPLRNYPQYSKLFWPPPQWVFSS